MKFTMIQPSRPFLHKPLPSLLHKPLCSIAEAAQSPQGILRHYSGIRKRQKIRPIALVLLWSLLLCVQCPTLAHAYLDPGTGSMLLSALVGIAATLFFMVKSFYYKAAGLFFTLAGVAAPQNTAQGMVFYSEGNQYWNTFKPILQALDAKEEKAVYLTSSATDPALEFPFKHITTQYIGQGSRAFALLNMLEADICVLTTPGLDVLQIHRSPGVRHYAHVVHAATDMGIYKLFSFDYYDSVLCSGAHQIRSLRHLEQVRKTPPKILFETGCPYMDVLKERLAELSSAAVVVSAQEKKEDACSAKADKPVILVAPTWGRNGLLSRFGLELLQPLAESGYPLIIRPHPQSFVSERDLVEKIAIALAPYPHVRWDREPDGLEAMMCSQVLVSDLSGIVFDYAFVLERPVITVQFDLDTRGLEASDLPWKVWELEILPQLGAHISASGLADIARVVAELPELSVFTEHIRKIRQENMYNFGCSGQVAAEQLLALRTKRSSSNSA